MRGRTAAVLIVLAVLFAGVSLIGRNLGSGIRVRFPSSLAAEPEGLLAFRRLLDALAIPTVLRTRPWDELADVPVQGVILIATPLQRPVDVREEQAMRSWLASGGRLLIVDDATTIERSAALDRIIEDAGLGGRAPLAMLDPSSLAAARPRLSAAAGTPAAPAGTDLARLMLHAEGGLDEGASGVPLVLREDAEVVAGLGSLAGGRVVRLLGPLYANDQLLAGDNLTLALRLVEEMREGGPVVFDEYHHGYGGVSPLGRGLDGRALVFAALQVLAAAGLYAAARGPRFGPPRIVPDPPRRSSLEFVRSMASLYRRARGRRHAIGAEIERLARLARGRPGAAPEGEAAAPAIARALASGDPALEARALDALRAAEAAHAKPECGEREMLARIVDLAKLEKEVLGGSDRAG